MYKNAVILLCLVLVLTPSVFATQIHSEKEVAALTARYHLVELKKALQEFPENRCIVKPAYSKIYCLSSYYSHGPLKGAAEKLENFGYEAKTIGWEIQNICGASVKNKVTLDFGADNDTIAMRDALITRVDFATQRIDVFLQTTAVEEQFIGSNGQEQADSRSDDNDSAAIQSENPLVALLGVDEEAEVAPWADINNSSHTLEDDTRGSYETRQLLRQAHASFEELSQRAEEIDESDVSARQEFTNDLRNTAANYMLAARMREQQVLYNVNEGHLGFDDDETAFYIRNLYNLNRIAENLENSGYSRASFQQSKAELSELMTMAQMGFTNNSTEVILGASN